MTWHPLLDGALADQARAAVLDIARAIANGEGNPAKVTDRTLFWAYVAGAFDDAWIADAYDAAVAELVASPPRSFADLTLYGGAAAFGFAVAHVSEPGTADASLEVIDALIADALAEPWTGDYDLIGGLAGIGVYLLERGAAPSARAVLDRVIDQLIATSITEPTGRTWLTAPHLIPRHQRDRYPDGAFNCGVAHGVPGAIAVLARAAAAGHQRAGAAALEASRWLAVAFVPGARDDYPAWIDRDRRGPPAVARHAWCYGEAGVSIAMFGAARRLGASTEPALVLARASAARPVETSMISDAGLCHGAAGLAHIYNRIYQACGDRTLGLAGRTWFARALELGDNPAGVAGFAANLHGPGDTPAWAPTTTLLGGAIGTALALLAAIRGDEPGWDRTLLCDLA